MENKVFMTVEMLGRLTIKEVLIYEEIPLVLTCCDEKDKLYIANCSDIDEQEQKEEWLLLPISEKKLNSALDGEISAYDLFRYPETNNLLKVVKFSDVEIGTVTKVQPNKLGEDDLPGRDAYYYSQYSKKHPSYKLDNPIESNMGSVNIDHARVLRVTDKEYEEVRKMPRVKSNHRFVLKTYNKEDEALLVEFVNPPIKWANTNGMLVENAHHRLIHALEAQPYIAFTTNEDKKEDRKKRGRRPKDKDLHGCGVKK